MFYGLTIFAFLGIILALLFNDILNLSTYFGTKKGKDKILFTQEELKSYDGIQKPELYLAILGNIFNVTRGAKHYGKGEQYHFFVGRDASKSFVTGDFSEEPSDDLLGLKPQDLKSLNHWLQFYKKEYPRIGKVIGRFYDIEGKLTSYAKQIRTLIKEAEQASKDEEYDKLKFPPCNIEWNAEKGSRVWCTSKSGGIVRSWTGKPRQYYEPGTQSYRCACIPEENQNLGNIKEYEGCDPDSESCFIKKRALNLFKQ